MSIVACTVGLSGVGVSVEVGVGVGRGVSVGVYVRDGEGVIDGV